MAINPETKYPGKINPSSADYPYGSARNITVPGDGTGTPWEAAIVNDLFGFQQALLGAAEMVPSGIPDKASASQYLEAVKAVVEKAANAYVTLEYADVDAMKSNTKELINTIGQKISTGVGRWKTTTTVTPVVISNTTPQLYAFPLNGLWVEDFGAVEGEDFSAELRDAVSVAEGVTVHIPARRYIYDGNTITEDVVKIKGARMPRVNDGFTSLENGTIIEGRFRFSGTNIHLENLGADLGSDTSAVPGDAIKCTAPVGTGKMCHLENVVGLGKDPSDAFHAVLIEGYAKLTGSNIVAAHNLFGVVIKCEDVQLDKIYTYRSQNDGLFLKSDTTFGQVKRANINSVIVDGNGGQVFGVRIQSDDARIDKINIGEIIVQNCQRSYIAEVLGANGVGINEINIDNFLSINASVRDIDLASNNAGAFIFTHSMGRVKCIGTVLEGFKASGVGTINHISCEDIFISYDAGASDGQIEAGGVQIGSTVTNTMLDKVTVCRNYSTATLGGINYANVASQNKLGMYTAKLFGSGVPLSGDSAQALSGSTATLDPGTPDWRGKNIITRVSLTANTTVTSFLEEQFSGVLYETGTVLTIINNSSFTLTINHSFGGNILNRASANFVLQGNETAMYVYGGAVWHQLN